MTVLEGLKSGTRVKYTGPDTRLSTGAPMYGIYGPSAQSGDKGVLTEDALTEYVQVTFPNGFTNCRVSDLEVISND